LSSRLLPRSPPSIYSVSEINRFARELVEAGLSGVSVEGEIVGLQRYPRSGHWYFHLKDRGAQLRCVMFRERNSLLRFEPAEGDRVRALGNLTIYEKRGDFQCKVLSLERSGAGALRQAFEALKARLQAEGLFDAAAKKPVGTQFRHIGIVTSPAGAALHDMINVFRRRFPLIRLTVIPTLVQGEQAASSICKALATANSLRTALDLEALIVARGGGSAEDLQAFNEESVARAIFASELPVTSAVGHETDFSIADFVADLRAPTPSAAAELMSPSQDEIRGRLRSQLGKLELRMRQRLGRQGEHLRLVALRLRSPARRLEDHAQALDELGQRLLRASRNVLAHKRQAVALGEQRLRHASPAMRIDRLREAFVQLSQRLERSMQVSLESRKASLAALRRGLQATGPLNTLARGYSITMNESAQVIRNVDELSEGSRIITRLADGSAQSTVTELSPAPHVGEHFPMPKRI